MWGKQVQAVVNQQTGTSFQHKDAAGCTGIQTVTSVNSHATI